METVEAFLWWSLIVIGGLAVLFVLLYCQFYLFIISHARTLRKSGWVVVTRYRANSAELNAVDPNDPKSFEYVKLRFTIRDKDEFEEN